MSGVKPPVVPADGAGGAASAPTDSGRFADTLRMVGAFAYHEEPPPREGVVTAYGLPTDHMPVLIIPEESIVSEGGGAGEFPKNPSELLRIHLDFETAYTRYQVYCVPGARLVVVDSDEHKTSITQSARRLLPNVADIAKDANGQTQYSFNPTASRSVTVQFNGGWIERAPRTPAKGHGRDFWFQTNQKVKYGKAHHMTDILDYRKLQRLTLDVFFGDVRVARVQPPLNGGVLWLANLSIAGQPDITPNEVEHSKMYYDFVKDANGMPPAVRPIAVTKDLKQESYRGLELPCLTLQGNQATNRAGQATMSTARFNPPDSEFCLQAFV